ncbi:GNAT family N-acetyltransferase [Permianibacter aggregans]|uniref:N-acetyltransferase domain-containing protein n=1 Tax=Permianibacter aggregans TaxID=1510150 RepID=A0A4R6UT99_9GAMM|nr:GNAT family N-acetyltransferase [Permianibacter aggregans]QGX38598.1 N-acetyltransferase [Permianibacter aggregans]TDQ50381.1 hypothetical protein EV696_10262 [Permianibacter aggregans]
MHALQYDTESDWYQQELRLRDRILRQPLGLELSESDRQHDHQSQHFAVVENEQMLACVIATPVNADITKLRQMAVEPDHQGKGIGRQLMLFAEQQLQKLGYQQIELHARETAIDFYRKLGYQTVGHTFIEQTITHIKMSKTLA